MMFDGAKMLEVTSPVSTASSDILYSILKRLIRKTVQAQLTRLALVSIHWSITIKAE